MSDEVAYQSQHALYVHLKRPFVQLDGTIIIAIKCKYMIFEVSHSMNLKISGLDS